MKEIDFLPEWYKSSRRRQISYRTQYIIIAGVFFVMVIWNFIAGYSISSINDEIARMQAERALSEKATAQLLELQNQINMLNKKLNLLDKVDPKINIANCIAELSYLVEERIVLSRIEITAERFEDKSDRNSSMAAGVVRALLSDPGQKKVTGFGDVRFKVLIAGLAADGSNVAVLMRNLEDSPYFDGVLLLFSKNTQIAGGNVQVQNQVEFFNADLPAGESFTGRTEEKINASSFEISCYLANYIQR